MVALINTALLRAMSAVSGLRARLSEERGQDLMEYAILGGFIALTAAVALAAVFLIAGGNPFKDMADTVAACVKFQATGCAP